jgi:calmodulin
MSKGDQSIYKKAFDSFDKDGSGLLGVQEIYKAFISFGMEITKEEVEEKIAVVDSDGSGEIDFPEFMGMINGLQGEDEKSEEDEVLRAFQTFDKNGNKFLDCREFKYILTSLGDKFTDEEVTEIFKEADLDRDGKLFYHEFIEFWKKK